MGVFRTIATIGRLTIIFLSAIIRLFEALDAKMSISTGRRIRQYLVPDTYATPSVQVTISGVS